MGYDASAVPALPLLLRRLHSLRASPAATHAGASADTDAVHAAWLLLLTAPAAIAARIAAPQRPGAAADRGALAGVATMSSEHASEAPTLHEWCTAIGVWLGG